MVINRLDFGGILFETLFLPNFLRKILDVFFQGQTLYWTYLRNGWSDWCETIEYRANYVILTVDLIHDFDLWFFKVKFQNSCISGIVIWLMWNKKKANQLDTGLTLWSCQTHDLDLVVSRSKFKIALFEEWGWGALIDMERKGWESIIHGQDRDLWVTMVEWVDVPYSDWGDFRRWCAVVISSSN